MNVSAKDKATGKSQSIRIEGSCGIDKEEIERMKKDAEAHAEEDKKKKEIIEQRNLADNLIYTTEKTLREAGDKVAQDKKKEIEGKVEELKKVKDGDNIEEIKSKVSDLSQAIQKIGAEMYKAASSSAKAPEDKQEKSKEKEDDKEKKAEEGEYKEK